jgi:hypothetical protein
VKEYPIAEVTWADASYYEDVRSIEWFQESVELVVNKTVGYILKTGKLVIVAPELCMAMGTARHVQVIPKKYIIGIEYLK